jgi:ATP-dependent helicase/DNAse subunit B
VPNEKYKQVYVAGMLEGEFPAHSTGKGFLTPEELSQWQRFGIPIYDPRLEPGFEYALFASLISRAQKQITFSYPAADIISSKEEPVPSFFLTGQNFVKESDQLEVLSFEDFSKTANSPRNALAYCLWRQETLTESARHHGLLNDFVHKLEEKLSFTEKRYQQSSLSPLSGYLVDHIAAGIVKVDLPEYWSASGLNEYGKCPFSYWLTRVLKVNPHSEPEAGLFIMEKGSFYHKVLELFYKEVIERKLSMTAQSDEELKAVFEQSITAGISWLEKERWFRPSEFWAQEKEDLIFHLRNFFDHERRRFLKEGGEFVPYLVEVEFGPQAAAKPLIINHDGRVIKLRGKIDRIDVESSKSETLGNLKRLRLIDYKSGSTLPTDADFESGRNIQLVLYALAAQEAIMPGSRVEDCSYLSVRAGKSSSQEGPVLQTYLAAVPDKVVQFVKSIEAGDFSLKPSNPNVCKSCDHQKVCRVKEFPKRASLDQEWEENNDD